MMGEAIAHYMVYEEVDIVCLLVLLVLLVHVTGSRAHSAVNLAFGSSCILAVTAIAADALREVILYRQGPPWAIILCSVVKALMSVSVLVNWLRFSILFLGLHPTRREQVLMLLPAVLSALAYLLSFFGIGTFWASAPGVYQRGPLFYMELYGFWIYALIQMVLYWNCRRRALTRQMRSDYLKMAAFGIFPAAGALLQYISGQAVPWIAPGVMLGVLQGFLVAQNREISMDPLTGISRRPMLERYLQDLLAEGALRQESAGGELWWFLMMDLDHFKSINDRFGHMEGDFALQVTARTLADGIGRRGCLVRYGGDEFAAVVHGTEEEIADLEVEIQEALTGAVQRNSLRYALHISIGAEPLRVRDEHGVAESIRRADETMYRRKHGREAVPQQ